MYIKANLVRYIVFIMAYHRLALSALLVATISTSQAFSPAAMPRARVNAVKMVATTPADLGIDLGRQTSGDNGDKNGAMMDLTGIVFSVS